MALFLLKNHKPNIVKPSTCWFADSAIILGKVTVYAKVSVWFGAVIRGDNEEIQIQKNSNIQENSILHTDEGFPLLVEEGCTIGHNSTLHGCRVGYNSLIGMGTTILNGAQIGPNCVVGAGSLILQEDKIPEGSLVVGRPGKVIRELSENEIKSNRLAAKSYSDKIKDYRSLLHQIID